MNLKDIEKIVKLMDEHNLSQFKLEQDETKLELKKGGDIDVDAIQRLMPMGPPTPMMTQSPVVTSPAVSPAEVSAGGLPAGVEEIKSPMVGTFYTAEKPDSDPFVKKGSQVETDSTVCIIEAMKVFNEIQAEVKGEIVDVLIENGTPVQYGEPLFLVKTS